MFVGGWPTLALLVSPAALGAPLRPLLRANRACGITATSTAPPSSKQASEFPPPITVSDGRTFRVFASESGVSDYIVARTEELMVAAIEAKGAVSLSVGSGTTVKPLTRLAGSKRIDFSRVHLFFGNERTVGDSAFKCAAGAAAFVQLAGIPPSQVHRFRAGSPDAAAQAYEQMLRGMPDEVAGGSSPSLDIVLLGSGTDGHTASLYAGSAQLLQSPSDRLYVEAEGKGGATITLDNLNRAKHVLVSAAKPEQAGMVAACLGIPPARFSLPAGQISTARGAQVEWLLTRQSAAQILPLLALTGGGPAGGLGSGGAGTVAAGRQPGAASSFGEYLVPYTGGVVAALLLASAAFAFLVLR